MKGLDLSWDVSRDGKNVTSHANFLEVPPSKTLSDT